MKFANKILALILATTMAFGGCVVASAAEDVDYAINNPYETVDFDNWGQYKADLHCHTTASDGDNTLTEMVEEHYAQGYDALAITDHGIVSRNWTTVNSRNYFKIGLGIKNGAIPKINPLTEERYQEIATGADRDGRPMVEIPMGIEQNPTSFNNAHVNSWFTEYGDGLMGGTSNYA